MRIQLDTLTIEGKYLHTVRWNFDQVLRFGGIALEPEGLKIHKRLSELEKGQIVEVQAETSSYDVFEGICEIIEIDLPTPENVAPMLFRFSGKLRPIY